MFAPAFLLVGWQSQVATASALRDEMLSALPHKAAASVVSRELGAGCS